MGKIPTGMKRSKDQASQPKITQTRTECNCFRHLNGTDINKRTQNQKESRRMGKEGEVEYVAAFLQSESDEADGGETGNGIGTHSESTVASRRASIAEN